MYETAIEGQTSDEQHCLPNQTAHKNQETELARKIVYRHNFYSNYQIFPTLDSLTIDNLERRGIRGRMKKSLFYISEKTRYHP